EGHRVSSVIESRSSLSPKPPLPERVERRQVYAIIGWQVAYDLAAEALLKAEHAIQGVALGSFLQSLALELVLRSCDLAKLVGHTPEVVQPAAAFASPLERLPLQRVIGA